MRYYLLAGKNYGYYEFTASISQLATTLKHIQNYFSQIKLGHQTIEHQLTVTQNLIQINAITDKVANNYKKYFT